MATHTEGPYGTNKLPDGNIEITANGDDADVMALVYGDDTDPQCWPVSANAALIAAAPDLFAALKALTSNPHVSLGDLVYAVRDREGLGWEGPAVKAWSEAVQAATAALAKVSAPAPAAATLPPPPPIAAVPFDLSKAEQFPLKTSTGLDCDLVKGHAGDCAHIHF